MASFINTSKLAELAAANKARQASTGSTGAATGGNGINAQTSPALLANGSNPSSSNSINTSLLATMAAANKNNKNTGVAGGTAGSTLANPGLGLGGANYNTADAATKAALEQNTKNLSDPAFVSSEIQRALGVKQNRAAQGLDTSEQDKYLQMLGYGGDKSVTDQSGGTSSGLGALQAASEARNGYQSTYTGPDLTGMESQLRDIFTNRQASELQKLRDARDVALQGYNSQETATKQNAYDSRNQADTTNLQNGQALKEVMANAGLTGDGQNLTLQAGQNAQRLGALGQINQQENNSLQDIMQQRSLLQNNEANNELALTQQINSDQASALYDLMKYGDQQAFNVDQADYGRYRDDINQQFAEDQFGWQKQTDLASLLGTINGQQTLAAQNQQFQQGLSLADLLGTYNGQSTLAGKNANLNAALQVGEATGKNVTPTQNWSDLFKQAGNSNTPLNLAGQQNQLNNTQVMAQLTGFLPDGTKTSTQQQQELQNLWAVADYTGTIPDELATLYGIPKGAQTQAAKQFAQQLSISQQNASTSRMSANNSISNANADNTRANNTADWNQKMDIWKATGKAPDGLGVPVGTPWQGEGSGSNKPDEPDVNDVYAEVYTKLDTMTPDQRKNFLSGEKAGLIKQFGPSGYKQLYGNYFDEDGNPL